jgi:hypothetical protein
MNDFAASGVLAPIPAVKTVVLANSPGNAAWGLFGSACPSGDHHSRDTTRVPPRELWSFDFGPAPLEADLPFNSTLRLWFRIDLKAQASGCPLWVISGQTITSKNAEDKLGCGRNVRFVPKSRHHMN